MKPTLIQYYEDTSVQNVLTDKKYSNSYQGLYKNFIIEWRSNSLSKINKQVRQLQNQNREYIYEDKVISSDMVKSLS
jgi:hypothetical protein